MDFPRQLSLFDGPERITPNIQVHIEGLNIAHMIEIKKMPTNITSLKMIRSHPIIFLDYKALILAQKQLKVLHFKDVGQAAERFTWLNLGHDNPLAARTPPIEELVVSSHPWTHSGQMTVVSWDWSRLKHLELRNMCLSEFSEAVPAKDLQQIKSLILVSCKHHPDKATDWICELIHEVKALEKVDVDCNAHSAIAALLKHGATLHSIALRNPCYYPPASIWLTPSIVEIGAIEASSPRLMELTIFTQPWNSSEAHVEDVVLSRMRNLRRLNIYTCTVVPVLPAEADSAAALSFFHTIGAWLEKFVKRKEGAEFEGIVVEVFVYQSEKDPYLAGIASYVKVTCTYRAGEDLDFSLMKEIGQ